MRTKATVVEGIKPCIFGSDRVFKKWFNSSTTLVYSQLIRLPTVGGLKKLFVIFEPFVSVYSASNWNSSS